jgi:alpha-1,3-rhamnosyl/mannosyltransferase
MSIAIFVGATGTQAGGMETYETHLLRALAECDQSESYHIYCLRPEVKELIGVTQPNFRYTVLTPRNRAICVGFSLPLLLAFSDDRLLHPTYIPPLFSPKPYVYTVHSSVTWARPDFYPARIRWRLNALQEKGIREARVILCVSGHVRDFVAERFRVPAERLAVVYHGVSPQFRVRRPDEYRPVLRTRYGIDYPYLLFAGKLKENKNISRLLQAHAQFRQATRSPVRLVLAGRRLWSDGPLDRELDAAVASGAVTELGHIEVEDMPILYNGAQGLVFPSLWEGFGIPILEAFASGIPVLTSNNSSLPEVAGGHAILVDPESVEELADGIRRLVEDTPLREQMIRGGLERAKEFTWRRTAEQTKAAYGRALSNS